MTGGDDVLYAGDITFASGKTTKGSISQWNNASGHYKPKAAQATQADLPLMTMIARIINSPHHLHFSFVIIPGASMHGA